MDQSLASSPVPMPSLPHVATSSNTLPTSVGEPPPPNIPSSEGESHDPTIASSEGESTVVEETIGNQSTHAPILNTEKSTIEPATTSISSRGRVKKASRKLMKNQ